MVTAPLFYHIFPDKVAYLNIADNLGYPGLFLTGAGLTVVGALLFWVYFHVPHICQRTKPARMMLPGQ
jgi:hypothetical protein